MKTILVDAVHTFIIKGEGVYTPMYELLEKYPNKKIVVTNAPKDKFENLGLDDSPYDVFTLEGEPRKEETEYFKKLFEEYNLTPDDVILFEHGDEAIESAESLGIKSYFYDSDKKDLESLKRFLDKNL